MRDGYHNGRQSWWWRLDDDERETVDSSDSRDSDRPATPPPEVISTIPGLIRKPGRSAPAEAGDEETRANGQLHVLLVEKDIRIRDRLVTALLEHGCHVNAFRSTKRAEIHAIYWGYDLLIASQEILEQTTHWRVMIPGGPPLGELSIDDSLRGAHELSQVLSQLQQMLVSGSPTERRH